jgi:hypothetical protein
MDDLDDIDDDDLLIKLKNIFDSAMPGSPLKKYPKEALPLGTYVRSLRYKKLGVITDAFYGELDVNNKKIIMYTVLLFPSVGLVTHMPIKTEQYYVTNEYEYEIIAYLMIRPVDLTKLTNNLGRGLFL